MFASAIGAPALSLTVPVIEPLVLCACATTATKSARENTGIINWNVSLLIMMPPEVRSTRSNAPAAAFEGQTATEEYLNPSKAPRSIRLLKANHANYVLIYH